AGRLYSETRERYARGRQAVRIRESGETARHHQGIEDKGILVRVMGAWPLPISNCQSRPDLAFDAIGNWQLRIMDRAAFINSLWRGYGFRSLAPSEVEGCRCGPAVVGLFSRLGCDYEASDLRPIAKARGFKGHAS